MDKHTILNEIARPSTLDGYMCNEDQKKKFQEYIDKQDIPNLGLFGSQGLGKSTLARIFVKNIDCDYIRLNAVEDRSIETIKEKIGGFASAGSFKPIKIVILEESSHLLEAAQVILLDMIETFSMKTRFILTGNYPERLIAPLRSRLQEITLIPAKKGEMADHVYSVLERENIKCKPEDLVKIINTSYPDLRKIFNDCQKYTLKGEIKLDNFKETKDDFYSDLLKELKSPKKSISSIRQILVDANKSDYEDVYKFLYDNIEKYGKKYEGEIIIQLEEGLHKAQTRLDKEINICATISRILPLCS